MKRLLSFISIITVLISINVNASARVEKGDVAGYATRNLVKTPVDQEVCFSPNDECDIKLERFIESAQKSVDVAIYDINLEGVVEALIVKSKTMPVRVIVDKRQSKGKRSLVPSMIKAGLNVRYGRQRGILHDKFTIIDNQMVEAGSFNYTNHASLANNENQFYSGNSDVVNKYTRQFDDMWTASSPAQAYKNADVPSISLAPSITPPPRTSESNTSEASHTPRSPSTFDGFIHY